MRPRILSPRGNIIFHGIALQIYETFIPIAQVKTREIEDFEKKNKEKGEKYDRERRVTRW